MSFTLVRCPVGYTSPDILVVVTSVFLGGDLPPRLPVRTVLCLPPANVPPPRSRCRPRARATALLWTGS